MNDVKSKWVLITGASSGIGEASAKLLASKGAHLILVARSEDKLRDLQKSIERANGKVVVIPTDLNDNDQLNHLYQEVKKNTSEIDYLINSAGAGRWLSMQETSINEFEALIENPLTITGKCILKFLPDMLKRNQGHIITLNSAASYFHFPGATSYSASRWGLRGLMNGLYEDLLHYDVKVSSIVAGKVNSPYFTTNVGAEDRIPEISNLLSRSSEPEEIAEVVWKCIQNPRRVIIHPRSMGLMVFLKRFMPGIFSYLMRKTSSFYKNHSI